MIREFVVVKTGMTTSDMYPTVFFDKEKQCLYNTRFEITDSGGVKIIGDWVPNDDDIEDGNHYIPSDDDDWEVLVFYPPTSFVKVEYAFREDTLSEQVYLDLIKLIHEPEEEEEEEEEKIEMADYHGASLKPVQAKSPWDMVVEDNKKKKPWWQRL